MANEFWSPIYSGSRFTDHTIPLELLEDLSVLQHLVIEIAKEIYYEENDKDRVPNGFTDGVSLTLSDVGEGSSIPKIMLAIVAAGSMTIANKQVYYEKAKERVIEYVDAIKKAQTGHFNIPAHHLHSFYRLGKNLFDDEAIDLNPDSTVKDAKLDKTTRVRVDNRLKNRTEEPFEIIGSVPTIDKGKHNFILEKNGHRVLCTYTEDILSKILLSFTGYNEGAKIKLKGIGVFSQELRLIGLNSIKEATPIPPPNVIDRLEKFRELKENWLDGQGKAFTNEFINWAQKSISSNLDFDVIPAPKIYPTPEGGIQLEWASDDYDASLTIESETKAGEFHLTNLKKKEIIDIKLDFNYGDKWNIVTGYIKDHFES